MKTALFVGRFQPFHLGHLSVVRDILEESEKVIILLGSANEKSTPENPFSVREREEMIKRVLDSAGIKMFRIGHVRDFHNDEQWTAAVEKSFRFEVVYSQNPWTIRCFKKAGYTVKRHVLYDRGKYSGVRIRQRMASGLEWKNLVPGAVYDYIGDIDGEGRVRRLYRKAL